MASAPGVFSLEAANFVRGAIYAVGTSVLSFLQQFFLPANGVPSLDISTVNWRVVGGVAAAAFVSYIIAKLGENKKGEILGIKASQPEAMKGK